MFIDDVVFRSLLNKGEEIEYVGHVHPFIIYPQLFKVMIFGILVPAGGYFLFPPFIVIWTVWGSIGTLLFSYRIIQWYLDAWIVTNYGVIDRDWHSIFDKATTRIEYGNIEGISLEIKGIWPTILRYGDLQIEHMSGQPISLKNVSAPRRLEKHVVRKQQEFLQSQTFEDHNKLKDLLTNLLRSSHKNG